MTHVRNLPPPFAHPRPPYLDATVRMPHTRPLDCTATTRHVPAELDLGVNLPPLTWDDQVFDAGDNPSWQSTNTRFFKVGAPTEAD